MSGKNLLVVFGGTNEGSNLDLVESNGQKTSNTVQSVFDKEKLEQQDMDLLQFNFITQKPSVSLRKAGGEVDTLLSGGYQAGTGVFNRALNRIEFNAVPTKQNNDNFDKKMEEVEKFLETTEWKDIDGDFNTGVRGMSEDTYKNFSDKARDVIFSYIDDIRGENYEKIIVMGHSRGAGLATRVANALYEEEKYSDKFLRLVLQDPVSKNAEVEGVDADTVVIPEGRDVVKKLADAGKEVHIIAKTYLKSDNATETSIFNYETYAPELIGTSFFYNEDGKLKRDLSARENSITDDPPENEPDMRNVYFHLAHMEHGYMLQGSNGTDNDDKKYKFFGPGTQYKAFHQGFGAYENIIKTDPWTTTYSNAEAIDIDKLAAESETLQKYIKGERSATEDGKFNPDTRSTIEQLNPFSTAKPSYEPNNLPDGDPLNKYYRQAWVNFERQGQDRQHALVHSLAYKVLIPTITIEVSATEAKEEDASEIVITATSNRTFENDQTVTLQFPQNSSDGSTATLGEDYTLSGFEQSEDNYTITIAGGSNTKTGTIKIQDDDQEEETEKVSFSIIKDGVLNKTSNLGEIKGINGTTQNIEITIIDDEKPPEEPQDDSNTDDSNTDDSNTDDSNTDDSNTDDSNTDDSNTDDSNTDDSNTDDSNTDNGGLNLDFSGSFNNTDDSNTDDSNTDDSNTDGSNTDGSNTDDSNTDNSNTDVELFKGFSGFFGNFDFDFDFDGDNDPIDLDGDGDFDIDGDTNDQNTDFDFTNDDFTDFSNFSAFLNTDFDLSTFFDNFDVDGDEGTDEVDVDGDGDTDGFDLDGDGDTDEVDIDGDGEIDGFDADGDGDIDPIDIDGDGDFDGLDIDGDGDIDGFDIDGDGDIDDIDIDGDGDIDGFDIDGDGDTDEIDIDGDGDFDGFDIDGDGDTDEVDFNGDADLSKFLFDLDSDGESDDFDFAEFFADFNFYASQKIEQTQSDGVSEAVEAEIPIVTEENDNTDGQATNDQIAGLDGNDVIRGLQGQDVLFGGNGDDELYGNQGADLLLGNQGSDTIHGGQGDDLGYGGKGNDLMYGDKGGDTLVGDLGDDSIFGGTSDPNNMSGDGGDFLSGGDGNDYLNGNMGGDELSGDNGNDTARGGQGDDIIDGDAGEDILYGDKGDDMLSGGTENDVLYGGEGIDLLLGGDGSDFLFGEEGNDVLIGHAGIDYFAIQSGFGSDQILDFIDGTDIIGLAGGLTFADLTITGNNSNTFISSGNELLATLTGIDVSLINNQDFTILV